MSEFVFGGSATDGKDGQPRFSGLVGALHFNRGKGIAQELSYKASRAFTDRSLVVMALAGLYLCWLFYMIWGASFSEPLGILSQTIENVISRETSFHYKINRFPVVVILDHFADVALVCLSFMLAQSFAASHTQARLLLFSLLPVFFLTALALLLVSGVVPPLPMSLTGYWVGYGYGTAPLLLSTGVVPGGETLSSFSVRVYEIGLGGVVYLYMLGFYFLLSFLAALARGPYQKLQAILGLSILLGLVLADRYLPADPRLEVFWFTGWSALAVLFVQSRSVGHKSARLHQA
ncbi:MAG: hypothetical protein LRY54_02060 [Alphaproteobacteria bacterium]|nr:hypothetical protein [Alphaproteobacteria bacterium]